MLEVYSSSAGSGKTYTLTREYLRLALEKPGFEGFAQLLAITFTKKATAELKDRILEELYRISEKDSSMAELLPYSEKARQMLSGILHSYSDFRVSTIDSFFSEIIRGFAREQKLSTGFSLEIDTDAVLQEALERLYQRIGDSPELTTLVTEWVMDRVKDGDSWDIRRELTSFARHGFNDTYRLLSRTQAATLPEEKLDEQFLKRKEFLVKEIKGIEEGFFDIAEPARQMLGENPDFDPFYYKAKGPAAWLYVLSKRDTDAIKPPNSYARAVADGKPITGKNQFVNGSPKLEQMVAELVQYADENLRRYYSLKAINENLITTYLLGLIMREVQQVKQERNIFLVADLGYFLSQITRENDAPFIYERIGASIRHFLIDEMQDTSGVQWEALRPLVDNAVAGLEGQKNFEQGTSLVVGDIKQAIYRWRNGDWKLLLHKIREDIGANRIRQKNLNTNFRSLERVVNFNNQAFSSLPSRVAGMVRNDKLSPDLQETLEKHLRLIELAYQGTEQKVGRQEAGAWDGFVEVTFLPEAKKEAETAAEPLGELGDAEAEPAEESLEKLVIDRLADLQDRGYSGGDICLLVRTHGEGQKIGAWMQDAQEGFAGKVSRAGKPYDFRFTSADTLVIGAASSVRLLVHLMGYLKDREDRISMTCILHEYYVYVLGKTPPDLNQVFGLGEGQTQDFREVFIQMMPVGFAEKMEELAHLPVYEVAEELVQFFRLYTMENETAYLLAFLNQTLAYQQTHRLDVQSFLDYYDEKGSKEKLALADDGKSIRIMTVHKAKGLEFEAVVIPFCNWALDHGGKGETLLWEHVAEVPGIPWAALRYRTDLIHSDYATHYLNEKVAAHLENLNLLYVAFTRAAQELHVLCPPKGRIRNNVGTILKDWLETASQPDAEGKTAFSVQDNGMARSFLYGSPAEARPAEQRAEKPKTAFSRQLATYSEEPIRFEYYSWRKRTLHLHEFNDRFEHVEPGTRRITPTAGLARVMLSANHKGASSSAMAEIRFNGQMDEDQLERLEKKASELVKDPSFSPFYDPAFSWRVRPLLTSPSGEFGQPGRMGIQGRNVRLACFHATPEKQAEHESDLQKIKKLAIQAGYKIDACALIYLSQNRVVMVD